MKTWTKIGCAAFAALMVASVAAGCAAEIADPAEESSSAASEATSEVTSTATEGGSDWDYIESKGNMIVGITYFAPMNYKDADGNLTGFETDLTTAVCEKLGITPEFQEINWDSKEVELNGKTIDCIWNGMTITDERKENMEISVPYMENRQVIVVKASNAEKYSDPESWQDATVVAEKKSAGEEAALEHLNKDKYTSVNSQANALMEVKAGTADMAIIDAVMTIGSLGEGTDYADLVVLDGAGFSPEEYGIAFRKGSDTAEKVNEALQELANDGTLNEIATKYNLQDLILVEPAAMDNAESEAQEESEA